MKKNKKIVLIVIACLLVVVLGTVGIIRFKQAKENQTMNAVAQKNPDLGEVTKETKLYFKADTTSKVLYDVPKGTKFTILSIDNENKDENGNLYYMVTFKGTDNKGYMGYILIEDTRRISNIEKTTQEIDVYFKPDSTSKLITTIPEGSRVSYLSRTKEYKDENNNIYYMISYKDENGTGYMGYALYEDLMTNETIEMSEEQEEISEDEIADEEESSEEIEDEVDENAEEEAEKKAEEEAKKKAEEEAKKKAEEEAKRKAENTSAPITVSAKCSEVVVNEWCVGSYIIETNAKNIKVDNVDVAISNGKYTLEKDGKHTVIIDGKKYDYNIDKTPPKTPVINQMKIGGVERSYNSETWYKEAFSLIGSSSDSESGIAYWQWSNTNRDDDWHIDTGAEQATTKYISSLYENDGNKTVYTRVCDNAGLCSKPTVSYINIDNAAPTLELIAFKNSNGTEYVLNEWTSYDVEVRIQAMDSGSGLGAIYRLDNNRWVRMDDKIKYSKSTVEKYKVCDKLDNCVEIGPYNINIDKTVPNAVDISALSFINIGKQASYGYPNTGVHKSGYKVWYKLDSPVSGNWIEGNQTGPISAVGKHILSARVCTIAQVNNGYAGCAVKDIQFMVGNVTRGKDAISNIKGARNKAAMQDFVIDRGKIYFSQINADELVGNITAVNIGTSNADLSTTSKKFTKPGHLAQLTTFNYNGHKYLAGTCKDTNNSANGSYTCVKQIDDGIFASLSNTELNEGRYGALMSPIKYGSSEYVGNPAVDNHNNYITMAMKIDSSKRVYRTYKLSDVMRKKANSFNINDLSPIQGYTFERATNGHCWQGMAVYNDLIYIWEGTQPGYLSIWGLDGQPYLQRYQIDPPSGIKYTYKSGSKTYTGVVKWEAEGIEVVDGVIYLGYTRKNFRKDGETKDSARQYVITINNLA